MDWIKQMEAEFAAMQAVDASARAKGELVGRYVQEQIADGYAYYVVVAETDMQMVKVEHKDIFDGWSVPMIESMNGIVPVKYVKENIARRDAWSDVFASRSN